MNEQNNENLNMEGAMEDYFEVNENYTILLNKKIGSGSFGQI